MVMKGLNILIIMSVMLLALLPVGLVRATSWVEVARFEGNRTTMNYDGCVNYTVPFTIDRYEWRIKWDYTPDFMVSKQFDVYVYRQGETTDYIAHINPPQEGYSGTYSIYNTTGTFYMKITYSIVENYSLIVEQNINSELLPNNSATPTTVASPTPPSSTSSPSTTASILSPSPSETASPTASPSPTVPEFSYAAVLVLATATCLFAVAFRKRR